MVDSKMVKKVLTLKPVIVLIGWCVFLN
jgi:hypothetical protein